MTIVLLQILQRMHGKQLGNYKMEYSSTYTVTKEFLKEWVPLVGVNYDEPFNLAKD